ncbi:MAG: hypothetical protein UY51_C0005G0654 [Candidatus Jorgensenbacteria bacterium GW2011_GWB1_49_9]|nr:MAG: hypothetical protein UY51_C0005G0654 [Candidatus Jorgensenbacteria bacterium GW2011_GWB1_49_9]
MIRARPVFFDRLDVTLGAVALVFVKTVSAVLFVKADHVPIAADLGHDRSQLDGFYFFVAPNHGFRAEIQGVKLIAQEQTAVQIDLHLISGDFRQTQKFLVSAFGREIGGAGNIQPVNPPGINSGGGKNDLRMIL